MKLVFLNVWDGLRRDELMEFIKDQVKDTDIFCFQEATDEMKHHFRDVLFGYKEISDYKFISDHDNFHQSIFIKDSITIMSSGSLISIGMDRGLAIYAKLKIGQDIMYVCNVHGIARPGNKLDNPGRIQQSSGIIEFFKDKQEPIVIGGDFNLNPETNSVKMFEEHGYTDLIKQFDIKTTRNHFAWDKYPNNKMYYSDFVFINNKVTCESFQVPNNEVSDHLPLILEIKI